MIDKETKSYDSPARNVRDSEPAQPSERAYRQSGRAVLNDRAERLRQRAADLDALAGALPAQLTPQQDQSLWNIVMEMRTQ